MAEAEVGDGLLVHAFTTKRYTEEVTAPALLRGLRRSGRERTEFQVSCPVFVVTGEDVLHGKPAPDLFLLVASRMKVWPSDCVVVEDSPAGVVAATSAGMVPIGFVGGSHASASLGPQLLAAGARTIIADMRQLKSTIIGLRGW